MVSDLLSSERAGVIALEFVSRGFSDLDDCTAVRNATAAPGEQQLAIGTPPPSDGPKGSDTARLPAAADSTDCGGRHHFATVGELRPDCAARTQSRSAGRVGAGRIVEDFVDVRLPETARAHPR